MKAIVCRALGSWQDLALGELPDPVPGPGEILVRVHAAGVNFLDALMAEGRYQTRPPLPFAPGTEVAGVVERWGPGVAGPPLGTRVFGFTTHGGYAERIVLPAAQAFPCPPGLSDAEAAGFAIAYGTSFHALVDRGTLAIRETLVVLGAAGGVGLTAVELGKRLGARVIAAASSDEKLALCRRYGADATINYAREDLKERVRALTDGRGADVVYDPVGGPYAEPMVRSLAPNGRYLVVGFAAGEIPRIPLNLLLLKQAALVGVYFGAWVRASPAACARHMATLLDWHGDGLLAPHVCAEYPLERFAEALGEVVARRAQGKVVLRLA